MCQIFFCPGHCPLPGCAVAMFPCSAKRALRPPANGETAAVADSLWRGSGGGHTNLGLVRGWRSVPQSPAWNCPVANPTWDPPPESTGRRGLSETNKQTTTFARNDAGSTSGGITSERNPGGFLSLFLAPGPTKVTSIQLTAGILKIEMFGKTYIM